MTAIVVVWSGPHDRTGTSSSRPRSRTDSALTGQAYRTTPAAGPDDDLCQPDPITGRDQLAVTDRLSHVVTNGAFVEEPDK